MDYGDGDGEPDGSVDGVVTLGETEPDGFGLFEGLGDPDADGDGDGEPEAVGEGWAPGGMSLPTLLGAAKVLFLPSQPISVLTAFMNWRQMGAATFEP